MLWVARAGMVRLVFWDERYGVVGCGVQNAKTFYFGTDVFIVSGVLWKEPITLDENSALHSRRVA